MKFTVNKSKKRAIETKLMKEHGRSHTIASAINVLFCIAVLVAVGLLSINLLDPDRMMTDVNGIAEKDRFAIWTQFISILSLSIMAFVALRVFLHGFTTSETRGRVDERLILFESKLYYVYRTRFVTPEHGANVVMLPLRSIQSASHSEDTGAIILTGHFLAESFPFFSDECPTDPGNAVLTSFTIYDYFEPELYPVIKDAVEHNTNYPKLEGDVVNDI